MNERIRELYGKASEYACNQLGHANQHVGKTLADVANEKFAELIVRECCQALETEIDSWQLVPYQGAMKRQGVGAIKQHFGIEE